MLIGLTGGIASGKSLVASRLSDLGAIIIDADELARDIVEPGQPALDEIRTAFGDEVLSADGTLNRAALGALVFHDSEKRSALEAITHPHIARLAHERIAAARDADPTAVIVYDIPLLVETNGTRRLSFDHIIVVHADAETRVRRLLDTRGLSRVEAEQRLRAQATDEERLAIADTVIDNTGSVDETLRRVDEVWHGLQSDS